MLVAAPPTVQLVNSSQVRTPSGSDHTALRLSRPLLQPAAYCHRCVPRLGPAYSSKAELRLMKTAELKKGLHYEKIREPPPIKRAPLQHVVEQVILEKLLTSLEPLAQGDLTIVGVRTHVKLCTQLLLDGPQVSIYLRHLQVQCI